MSDPTNQSQQPDPVVAARLLSDQIFDNLVRPFKVERRIPSLQIASILGALAGHACQLAALKGLDSRDPNYAGRSLMLVGTTSGEELLFGDAINRPLLETPHSVWALVGGILHHMGFALPDPQELVDHVARTLPNGEPWLPRDLPPGSPTPRTALQLWGFGELIANSFPYPDYVPVVFALAYQRLAQTDNAVDPTVDQLAMARVMMESAIAMSKVQATPRELGAG